MKRFILIGASLALGIFAAAQLPAAPHQLQHQQGGQSIKTAPKFGNGSFGNGSFGNGGKNFANNNGLQSFPQTKPFKPANPVFTKPGTFPTTNPTIKNPGFPIKPIKPIDNPVVKPWPHKDPGFPKPIIKDPGFPIKPIKPIDNPVVKPWPIKPINPKPPIDGPVVKPWPIKPIKPDLDNHHHHCDPHWLKPCYAWMWYGSSYVVTKPIVVHVPVVVNQQVEQLPEVTVGATITLPAQGLGNDAGIVMLRIGDMTFATIVNQWTDQGVEVTLPMIGLENPKRAEIVVLFANGQVALSTPVKLLPAIPPAQQ